MADLPNRIEDINRLIRSGRIKRDDAARILRARGASEVTIRFDLDNNPADRGF